MSASDIKRNLVVAATSADQYVDFNLQLTRNRDEQASGFVILMQLVKKNMYHPRDKSDATSRYYTKFLKNYKGPSETSDRLTAIVLRHLDLWIEVGERFPLETFMMEQIQLLTHQVFAQRVFYVADRYCGEATEAMQAIHVRIATFEPGDDYRIDFDSFRDPDALAIIFEYFSCTYHTTIGDTKTPILDKDSISEELQSWLLAQDNEELQRLGRFMQACQEFHATNHKRADISAIWNNAIERLLSQTGVGAPFARAHDFVDNTLKLVSFYPTVTLPDGREARISSNHTADLIELRQRHIEFQTATEEEINAIYTEGYRLLIAQVRQIKRARATLLMTNISSLPQLCKGNQLPQPDVFRLLTFRGDENTLTQFRGISEAKKVRAGTHLDARSTKKLRKRAARRAKEKAAAASSTGGSGDPEAHKAELALKKLTLDSDTAGGAGSDPDGEIERAKAELTPPVEMETASTTDACYTLAKRLCRKAKFDWSKVQIHERVYRWDDDPEGTVAADPAYNTLSHSIQRAVIDEHQDVQILRLFVGSHYSKKEGTDRKFCYSIFGSYNGIPSEWEYGFYKTASNVTVLYHRWRRRLDATRFEAVITNGSEVSTSDLETPTSGTVHQGTVVKRGDLTEGLTFEYHPMSKRVTMQLSTNTITIYSLSGRRP